MSWDKWSERVQRENASLKAEVERLKAEAARAAPVLVSAIEIGKWWRIQDGIAGLALEELADAVKVYLGEAKAEEPEE